MTDRLLICHGIIALDLMIADCMERNNTGKELHPEARKILEYITQMLANAPPIDHNHQQYILNVTEIAYNIKKIFLCSTVSEPDLKTMLQLQADRIEWLNSDPTLHDPQNHKVH